MDEVNEVPEATPGPARRRVMAWSLVAAGLLGGAVIGGTIPAGAQTTTEAPEESDSDDSRGRDGKDCPDKAERAAESEATTT